VAIIVATTGLLGKDEDCLTTEITEITEKNQRKGSTAMPKTENY